MTVAVRYCSQCHALYPQGERFCPVDGSAILDREGNSDPLIGQTIGDRYLIRRCIGQGGMGVVYEADHVALDKRVAVKFLLDKYTEDREVLARFHQEARTASRIGHENIIDITDIGGTEPGQRCFIAMEYLEGADLSQVLATSGAMEPERAINIIGQVLGGLAAAHAKGIIHRDMKPENVFLTTRGSRTEFVKVMDFGISKIIDAHDSKVRLTETGAVVGTPIYMAPEQARADQNIDQRADIYAVGVMFHELLCGRPPFEATSYLELVTQHLFDAPPPLRQLRPNLPVELEQVILKALEKDPAARHASAPEFARALPPASPGAPPIEIPTISGGPEPPGRRPVGGGAFAAPTAHPSIGRKNVKRRSMTPFIIVASAVLAAGAMIALTLGSSGSEPSAAAAAPADAAPAGPSPSPSPLKPTVEPMPSLLEIDSRPQKSKVFVDGEYRGETPMTIKEIDDGNHTVRLERDGYQTLEAVKKIRAGYNETFFGALAVAGSHRPSKATTGGRRHRRPHPATPGTNPRKQPTTAPLERHTPAPGPRKPTKPNPYLEKKPSPYGP